jgi:hypothetical protein
VPFDLGDTARLSADCTDAGGTLANAASVVLTVTLPDGTTTTPPVTTPPAVTGRYAADYVTTQAGRHLVRWVFTGPACAYTDALDVRPAAPALLLSLADIKKQLNIVTAVDDEELRGWIESVTEGVESLCGPIVVRTFAEKHDVSPSGVPQLALLRTPAIALTSLVAVRTGGTSYATSDLDLDGPTGIVVRRDGGLLRGPLRATYTAGRTETPATISAAARIIFQHLWRTKYGSSRGLPSIGGSEDYAVTEPISGFGYAIPNRALQLLEPYRLPPMGG